MATVEKSRKEKVDKKKLLQILTYEIVNGKPIYYRGYKEVLKGKKQPEEVMGASAFQSFIVKKILVFLVENLESNGYEVLSHEIGIKSPKSKRALDIGIFRKEDVETLIYKAEFLSVPPVVAIEIDTKAELEDNAFMTYMRDKIRDLFDFGVKRVIWIFTKGEVVVIADDPKSWKVLDWDDEFEIWEGVKVKLSELIKQR